MAKDPNEIGALWLKHGPKASYLSGVINGENVVVFKNTHKTDGSKQPDYRVLKSQPKPKTDAPAPVSAPSDDDIGL